MSVEQTLFSVLTSDPTVAGMVVDRVRPIEAAQGETVPYVVYELVSSVPVESPETGTETNESVIDVACYGTDYANSKALAKAVRAALINGLGASVIDDTNDFRDDATQRKSVVQTYRIWHDETFP